MTFSQLHPKVLLLLAAITTLFGSTISLHAETINPTNTEILLQRLQHPDPLDPLPEAPIQDGKLVLPVNGNMFINILPQDDGTWGKLVTVDDQSVYQVQCDDGNSVYVTQSPIFADEPEKSWFIYIPCAELPLMRSPLDEANQNVDSSACQNSLTDKNRKPLASTQKEITPSPLENAASPQPEKTKESRLEKALSLTYKDLCLGNFHISGKQPFYEKIPKIAYNIALSGIKTLFYFITIPTAATDFFYRYATL